MYLRELGVDLEQKDVAAGLLGVNFNGKNKTGLIDMKQIGLIQRVIEALGLGDGTVKGKYTCQSDSQSPTDLESTQSDSQSPTDLESTQSQNIGNARTKCLYVHKMPIRK